MKKLFQITFSIAFFGILLLPRIQQKTNIIHFDFIYENRNRTAKPAGNMLLQLLSKSSTYPAAYEKFFNDNYGLRDFFIRIKNGIDHKVFHVSDDVALGPDDWMEYRNVIENQELAGERLSKSQENKIIEHFDTLQVDLEKRGITLVLVAIPNKNSIYPEYFPNTGVLRPDPTAFDRFTAMLLKNKKLHVIDAKPILLDAKQKGHQVFYKTDFHWNQMGAYYVNEALINTLGTLMKTGTRWDIPPNFKDKAFQGVLLSSLATPRSPMETGQFLDASPSGKQKKLPTAVIVGNSFYLAMHEAHISDYFTKVVGYHLANSQALYTEIDKNPDTKIVVVQFIEINLGDEFPKESWWDNFMR